MVFMTAPDTETAAKIAGALLDSRLAACVNIVGGVRSIYWWEGKINDDAEVLCIIKTTVASFDALADMVKSLHPYEVPEIIMTPIARGSERYLKWIGEYAR